MKISKKLLAAFSVAAMLVTALSVTGCKKEEDDDTIVASGNSASIDYTNETTDKVHRVFSQYGRTAHYGGKCLIENLNAKTVKTNKANGTMGYVFGLSEKDNKYTFGIAAIRYNKETGKPQWYVEWCKDIPKDSFKDTENADFAQNGVGSETYILPTTNGFADLNNAAVTDVGSLSIRIIVTAGEGKEVALVDGTKVTAPVGSYLVEATTSDGTKTCGHALIPASVTGLTERTQLALAYYSTTYATETLKGRWTFTDVVGNPIPADE